MDPKDHSFDQRKKDHVFWSLQVESQSPVLDLDALSLIHEALPENNLENMDISTPFWGRKAGAPVFISSMTAGHQQGQQINLNLALAAQEKNWILAVGSQRKQLFDIKADQEWNEIRKKCPRVRLLGNLGLAQLIVTPLDQIKRIVDSIAPEAFIVHLNPLQECLQVEGTPQFKGGLSAIEQLVKNLPVPVVVKEVGCGISLRTAERLLDVGVSVIDVAGRGGTHWGKIEGLRAQNRSPLHYQASQTFANWGLSTVQSLWLLQPLKEKIDLWASGGVRSGLDVAKLLALGAKAVGMAQPFLQPALESADAVLNKMNQLEFELKIALFCSGCQKVSDLNLNHLLFSPHLLSQLPDPSLNPIGYPHESTDFLFKEQKT